MHGGPFFQTVCSYLETELEIYRADVVLNNKNLPKDLLIAKMSVLTKTLKTLQILLSLPMEMKERNKIIKRIF